MLYAARMAQLGRRIEYCSNVRNSVPRQGANGSISAASSLAARDFNWVS